MHRNKTIFEQSRAEQSRAEQSRAEQSRAEQSSLTALFAYLKILITISSTLQAEEIIRLYVLLFCVFIRRCKCTRRERRC